jgi:hypothetical protein
MNWIKGLIIVVVVALLVAGGVWVYQFFQAPESVEAVSEKWAFSGHADANSDSFTHWNEDDPPEIPDYCAKCHSMYGYLDFLGADGSTARQVDSASRVGSVVSCWTCHNEPAHEMTQVTFPSGIEITEPTQSTNCMQCHQGREATSTVNEALAGVDPDAVSEDLGFINVHYAVAAATLLGGDAQVGYQYDGKSYVGRFAHVEDYDTCIECHDSHSTFRNPDECSPCHLNVVDRADLREIRESETDYDGDGNVDEPILDEVNVFHDELYAALQDYAANVIGQPIVYGLGTFPYYFNDTNGNGEADADELNFGNQYASWTPRLVRAAYNYHYVHKDPGAYTHNARYVFQLLYDSMEDLGQAVSVDLANLTRP